MKEKILRFKNKFLSFFTFIYIYANNYINVFAATPYDDVPFIHKYLIIDRLGNSIKKMVGNMLFDFLSPLLNICYDAFIEISTYDILQVASIKKIIDNANELALILAVIVISFAIISKIFKLENPISVFMNVIITMLAIITFSTFMSYASDWKLSMMGEIDAIIEKSDNTISDKIYADNTVDVLMSIKKGEVVKLKAEYVSVIDVEERILKGDFIEYQTVDPNTNEVTISNLPDGWVGIGDVRYFRYFTDFKNVNFVILTSIVVFFMGILKMGIFFYEWLNANVFGGAFLIKGVFDYQNIKNVVKPVVEIIVGELVTYASMLLYTIISSEVLSTANMSWLAKCGIMFGIGIGVLNGSQFINNKMGITDNSMRAMGGMFVGSRMFRGVKRNAKNGYKSLKKGKQKFEEKANKEAQKMYNEASQKAYDSVFNNDDLHNSLNEDLPLYEHDKAKEDILNKENKKKEQEQIYKELYGDDYKVKFEEDKIKAKKEQQKATEKANKKLYGDNYKNDEIKEKITNREKENILKDEVMKELYGDDYKEKQIKTKAVEKAKTEVYKKDALQEIESPTYTKKEKYSQYEEDKNEFDEEALNDFLSKYD